MCQVSTIPAQGLGLLAKGISGSRSIIDQQQRQAEELRRRTALLQAQSDVLLSQSTDGRRCVQFAAQKEVFDIPHLDDICDEEYDETWYSPDEIDAMVQEAKSLAAKIDQGCLVSGVCTRGLEQNTKSHRKRLLSIAELKFQAISSLQDFQKLSQLQNNEIPVDDAIADICRRCSSQVVQDAIEVAKKDAIDARLALHC